jgi:RNA polymerase sigma-70 factor (ECF subfamily)
MDAATRVDSEGPFDQGTCPDSASITSEPEAAARSDAPGDDQSDQSDSIEGRVDWHELVARIRSGDNSGLEDLYGLFARGIRFYLCRQLGPQELDDKVHDAFLIVVQAIKRGDLREPERLMGFVRTVVRRQVAAYIDDVVHSRREELHLDVGVRVADGRNNPEQTAAFRQKVEFMTSILQSLSDRDREILTRFYLDEQTQEQICEEMDLSETQFRLLKSRAKARFGELGKRKLQQKPLVSLFLRTSAHSEH